MEVTLALDSLNKIYYAGENITGKVLLINKLKSRIQYNMYALAIGYYKIKNMKNGNEQILPFYKKKLLIRQNEYNIAGDSNSIAFRFPLNSQDAELPNLYETYQGVKISLL